MDSVEGHKGGKVFPCHILQELLIDAFYFTALLPVILTDRGSEFEDALFVEFIADGAKRTHIFYCNPQRSDQKGGIEVTHEIIRLVLPEKTSFDNAAQDDVSLMRRTSIHTKEKTVQSVSTLAVQLSSR